MLDYLIFALVSCIFLVILVLYLYPGCKKNTTVPSPDPSDAKDGNLGDIARAGSLPEYLHALHLEYGPITGFFWGEQFVVSIASPQLFKEHSAVFDKPGELFNMFSPLIDLPALNLTNGGEGRQRRQKLEKYFTPSVMHRFIPVIQETADCVMDNWSSLRKRDHVPLQEFMHGLVFRILVKTCFGENFSSDKLIAAMKLKFDVVWTVMEKRLQNSGTWKNDKAFDAALEGVRNELKIARLKAKGSTTFLAGMAGDEKTVIADCLAVLTTGYRSMAAVLTWAIYFVSTHPDVQTRLQDELDMVFEGRGDSQISLEDVQKLRYLHQVVDETLRCASIFPWTARVQSFDTVLGGHTIPKDTPVIHALGVLCQDEKLFPQPDKFDPDRFSEEQVLSRPEFSFCPFGFAGNRKCCASSLVYLISGMILSRIFSRYRVRLALEGKPCSEDDTLPGLDPVYSLVTVPEEQVWVTLETRSSDMK